MNYYGSQMPPSGYRPQRPSESKPDILEQLKSGRLILRDGVLMTPDGRAEMQTSAVWVLSPEDYNYYNNRVKRDDLLQPLLPSPLQPLLPSPPQPLLPSPPSIYDGGLHDGTAPSASSAPTDGGDDRQEVKRLLRQALDILEGK